MAVKNKIIRIIAVALLIVTTLAFSFGVILMLSYYGILPTDHSTGIFDVSLAVAGYCGGIGTLTGVSGIWLHRISDNKKVIKEKKEKKKLNPKKIIGSILIAISVIALTYSLYLILYYFDIIPNRNLGFLDISHLVAGIVAVPASIIGTVGILMYRSGKNKKE